MTRDYPHRIAVEHAGEITELAARVTDHELPTGAPSTVIEFSPDDPPLPSGALITFSTITITE
jgi:hypothetical protein